MNMISKCVSNFVIWRHLTMVFKLTIKLLFA